MIDNHHLNKREISKRARDLIAEDARYKRYRRQRNAHIKEFIREMVRFEWEVLTPMGVLVDRILSRRANNVQR